MRDGWISELSGLICFLASTYESIKAFVLENKSGALFGMDSINKCEFREFILKGFIVQFELRNAHYVACVWFYFLSGSCINSVLK